MEMTSQDQEALQALDVRLRTILPEEYQDCYEDVQPVSMGSAGLKYGRDGKVAWDEIWGSFCDLAMAGGPPHRGSLLEPGSQEELDAQSGRYSEVVREICRGIRMVTDFAVNPSEVPGWVDVDCASQSMAEWLVRAIVMENISARCEGEIVYLPAGSGYRIEKEIKNIITAIAKTSHYWIEHMDRDQHREIGSLFTRMGEQSPLMQPAVLGHGFHADQHQMLSGKMAKTIRETTGLRTSDHHYAGWLGVECPDVRAAIWMMRALVASNVLSRREETVLFVPVNPATDPNGEIVTQSLAEIFDLANAREVL
jgi:sirohydrochlorin cobaltochelatase